MARSATRAAQRRATVTPFLGKGDGGEGSPVNAATLPRLCLIEDDEIMGESLSDRFRLEGFAVDWHRSAGAARKALAEHSYAVAISDINLPDESGEALFRELLGQKRALPPFVFITGYGTIDSAVQLVKLGAA
ncbi:MAG: hypothetical protein C0522_15115, partial [Rhodocyclaceae bacterium]|nr:hypothetical protein [Rhodocyclaceae bacterium]